MKELWVLSVRTSLPDECYSKDELKLTMTAFETFEKAKNAMRDTMKGFAFSQNSMFDGKGRIIAFDKYIEDMSGDEFWGEDLTKSKAIKIHNALAAILNGEDSSPDIEKGEYTDYMIAFKYDGESIVSYGDDDGPCNGYNPYIATNAFSMEQEKDYYIYIDDLFGQDASSELYIDLKKVEVK